MKINCKVCNNNSNNLVLTVSEMMLETGDKFKYCKCSSCGCLSLLNIPKDIDKYYPSSYYSFTKIHTITNKNLLNTIKRFIRVRAMKGKLGCGTFINSLIYKIKPIAYDWLKKDLVSLNSKILDVGCGNGFLVNELEKYGFNNLIGIDLYTDTNIESNGYKIYQSNIHSLDESKFDLIMYHHSFEHINNPHKELKVVYDKLKDDGTLILRVPVCDSYAFEKYKQNWVQLDAPRHYFLYTIKSMSILSEENGFKIDAVYYDSNVFQFIGSECYLQNVKFSDYKTIFTESDIKEFEKKSNELNLSGSGDQVCFYLKKNINFNSKI
ncbi:MAG: class I SAM-dependent methyltransferase [Sulfurovum sp.]